MAKKEIESDLKYKKMAELNELNLEFRYFKQDQYKEAIRKLKKEIKRLFFNIKGKTNVN